MKAKKIALCLLVLAIVIAPVQARNVYGHLVLGGEDTGLSFECIFMVSNKVLTERWEGKVTLLTGADEDWEGNWSVNGEDFSGLPSFPVSLESAGSATFVITGDSMIRSGYLEFRGDPSFHQTDLATTFFYQVKQGGELIDSIGTGPTEPGLFFAFPIQQNSSTRTGMAWVALAHIIPLVPEEIRIGIFDPEGAVFEIKTVPYEGYKAQFIDELFPDLPEEFQGTMMVNSEKFIHITVLRQDTLSSGAVQFTNTPPDDRCFRGDCDLDEARP